MGQGASRRTALVTGAAGFLGSHLVDALLERSYEVVGLDNLMTGDLNNLVDAGRDSHFHFQVGDVREPLKVYPQVIFNFACPASPVHYQADPHTTFTTSVLGALRIIENVRGRNCTVVHASTSEVYGDPDVHPQPESYWGNVNPIGPRACYDEGKRGAETLFSDAVRMWNTDARIIRIFNTYGPRMALNDGRVVSNFIRQAICGEPITIFGDGRQTRSFCFVSDLIEGIIRIAEHPTLINGPINLGNDHEFTMIELASIVLDETWSTSSIVHSDIPIDDPRQRRPDLSRARELIAHAPKVDLNRGVKMTSSDFQRRLADHQ